MKIKFFVINIALTLTISAMEQPFICKGKTDLEVKQHVAQTEQEKNPQDSSAMSNDIVEQYDNYGTLRKYRKDIVERVITEGYLTYYRDDATQQRGYLFPDGTFADSCNDSLHYFTDHASFNEYLVQHNDTINFLGIMKQETMGSGNVHRNIGCACKNGNAVIFQALLDEYGMKPATIYYGLVHQILQCYYKNPQILEIYIEWLQKQFPATWKHELGQSLNNFFEYWYLETNNHAKNIEGFKRVLDLDADLTNNSILATLTARALRCNADNNPYVDYIALLLEYGANPFEAQVCDRYNRDTLTAQKSPIELITVQGKDKATIRKIRQLFFRPAGASKALAEYMPRRLNDIVFDYLVHDEQDLIDAVEEEKPRKVKYLIDCGFNPNVQNKNKKRPLHYAAERGDTTSMEYLLLAGADPIAQENHGMNALMLAAELGQEHIVELLIDYCSWPPAKLAEYEKNKQWHLSRFFDEINMRHTMAESIIALMASYCGKPHDVLGTMINAQSTYTCPAPSTGRRRRRLAADAARNRYRKRAGGAAPSSSAEDYEDTRDDVAGSTALLLAAKNGHAGIVKQLLNAKADASIPNAKEQTALSIARDKQHGYCAAFLNN